MKAWKHDELMYDLAEHLDRPERMVWTDMQLGPVHSARPDIFTMSKSYTNPKPIVYEIKVSVSDFRSDITSGKWQKYREFASGIVFATPAGLITKRDIPTGCGLIVRGDEGWRTLKAPRLEAVQLKFPVMQKLLIDGIKRYTPERRRNHHTNWLRTKAASRLLGEDVARTLDDLSWARQELEGLQTRIDSELTAARAQAQALVDKARTKADELAIRVTEEFGELYDLLGLERGSSAWLVRNKIEDLRRSLDKDSLVTQMRHSLAAIERAAAQARDVVGETPAFKLYKQGGNQ